jgi:hypothetical protein
MRLEKVGLPFLAVMGFEPSKAVGEREVGVSDVRLQLLTKPLYESDEAARNRELPVVE